jgi:hypothetical protein
MYFNAIACEWIKAVGDGAWMPGQQLGQPRIVCTEDDVMARLGSELAKLAADGIEVFVIVEMFRIDVQDDRVTRIEFAQTAIAFIRFDDEQILRVWHVRASATTRALF